MPNINFLIFCKTSVYFRTKEGRKKNTVRTKSFISISREFLNSLSLSGVETLESSWWLLLFFAVSSDPVGFPPLYARPA